MGVGPLVLDPSCSTHREEPAVGAHGEPKGFREMLRPPEEFEGKPVKRISWYVGIFVGVLIVCVAVGLVVGLILAVINWVRL